METNAVSENLNEVKLELTHVEYIYLIKTHESTQFDDEVYKIGRTSQLNCKQQYPKGGISLFQMICKNSVSAENDIKQLFNTKYRPRTEYGTTYFQGNLASMIEDISAIVMNTFRQTA